MTEELTKELEEAITKLKVPANLAATVQDAYIAHELFVTKLGVKPENAYILADEAD